MAMITDTDLDFEAPLKLFRPRPKHGMSNIKEDCRIATFFKKEDEILEAWPPTIDATHPPHRFVTRVPFFVLKPYMRCGGRLGFLVTRWSSKSDGKTILDYSRCHLNEPQSNP